MSKNILDNLFGSRIRVKILKYVFRNYPSDFSVAELSQRLQEPGEVVKKEVQHLHQLGLIKTKSR